MSRLHQLLLHHVMGNLHIGNRCPLSITSLKHVQLFLFNGELEVLYITKFLLEPFTNFNELLIGVFEDRIFRHGCHGKRCSNTSNNIFTLGIHKVFTIESVFTSCGISGKGNARCAVITHVAKHHGLDIDRGSPLIRNFVLPTIQNGSFVHPASEYGSDRTDQLFEWILREIFPGTILNETEVSLDEFTKRFLCKLCIVFDAELMLQSVHDFIKWLVFIFVPLLDTHHDITVHLDKPAI